MKAQIPVQPSLIPSGAFGYANLSVYSLFHLPFFNLKKGYSTRNTEKFACTAICALLSPACIILICFANHVSCITRASKNFLNVHTNYFPPTSHSYTSWRYLPARSSPGSVPPIPTVCSNKFVHRPF